MRGYKVPGVAWAVQAPWQGESMMIAVMDRLVMSHRSDSNEWSASAYETEKIADQEAAKTVTLFEEKFGSSKVVAGPVLFTVPADRAQDPMFVAETVVCALEQGGPTECDGLF